jgi:signal peptide peptidase SppA
MFDLPHVAPRVFGTPLMIARAKLDVVLGVLAPRLAGGSLEPIDPKSNPAPQTRIVAEGIAVVPVTGTLVARSGYLAAASGLLSYADIGDAIEGAMSDPAVRGVILDVDSPGGEVGGLFDLAGRIRSMTAASDKPLWAAANESALSAAYAIASTSDRLYVTRTGEVGSIGVVAVHVDESGADAKAGLAWTFVFAGERKVDGNAHEPLSERARATIQADVDRLYAEFCALVAANRGLTAETARATNAAIYRGELAIRAGLADRLGTLDLAIAEMAVELDRASTPRLTINPTLKRSLSMATNETEQIQNQPREQQLAVDPAPAPIEAASDPAPVAAPAEPTPCAKASPPRRCAARFSMSLPRAPRRPTSSLRRLPLTPLATARSCAAPRSARQRPAPDRRKLEGASGMPTLTMAPALGDLLKYELNASYCREMVTLKAGTNYAQGSVLGKITASGKYCLSPAAQVVGDEGAETAVAVLIEAVDATAADKTGLVAARGPAIVSKAALVFDASVDQAAEKSAKHSQLAAAGIVPRDTA